MPKRRRVKFGRRKGVKLDPDSHVGDKRVHVIWIERNRRFILRLRFREAPQQPLRYRALLLSADTPERSVDPALGRGIS